MPRTSAQTSGRVLLLTSLRFARRCPRRPGDSGGAGRRRRLVKGRRRRREFLGFGEGGETEGDGGCFYRAEPLGVLTREPGARRRGRRFGVCPERDPGSDAGSTGGGRLKLTHRPRVSAAGWHELTRAVDGLEADLGCARRDRRR
jgi:hypothetical protein